jgi:hypothetical protein
MLIGLEWVCTVLWGLQQAAGAQPLAKAAADIAGILLAWDSSRQPIVLTRTVLLEETCAAMILYDAACQQVSLTEARSLRLIHIIIIIIIKLPN